MVVLTRGVLEEPVRAQLPREKTQGGQKAHRLVGVGLARWCDV